MLAINNISEHIDDKIYYLDRKNQTELFFKFKPNATPYPVRINKYVSDEMKDQPSIITEVL